MRLRARLRILEESTAGLVCPGCRHRGGIIFRTSTQLPNGTRVWDVEKPLPCPRCGKIPEMIIEVILSVVDERSNASEYETSS